MANFHLAYSLLAYYFLSKSTPSLTFNIFAATCVGATLATVSRCCSPGAATTSSPATTDSASQWSIGTLASGFDDDQDGIHCRAQHGGHYEYHDNL